MHDDEQDDVHDDDEHDSEHGISRRRMVALGTLGGAVLLGADAVTGPAAGAQEQQLAASDPGGPRLGSALIGGYSYVYRSYRDFFPLDNSARSFAGNGAWGTVNGDLRTTVELPFGAVLRDLEFYVASSVEVQLSATLWRSQVAQATLLESVKVSGTTVDTIRAMRFTIPSDVCGPYAPGSQLYAGVGNTSSTTKINGVRVGYTRGPGGVVMLDKPVRAYDSRSGAKIGNGQTRIHSLASYVPAGATAAIVNLTVTGGEKSGGLAVYGAGTTVPTGSALYWTSATVSNELHTRVTSDRLVKVTMRGVTGSKCHYFFDVVGYAV